MQKLHPGVKWQFRLGAYFVFIPLFIISINYFQFLRIVTIATKDFSGISITPIYTSIFISILFSFLITILFGEIYARMAYNRWKFEFTETNLKKEQGIIWKRYSNIPYERVQNVDIQRGVIARIFGFSSIMIHTAGYSGHGKHGIGAEGYIPAVSPEYAEKIRDFLMHKISKKGNSGGL
jgi:membrane protein YdbS with pleckstrin-like domain